MMTRTEAVAALNAAFDKKNLTLYLGAGVSVSNGLPTWNQLILAMYFAAISEERMHGWRPFSNYLYAIAEYQLERSQEPLEIMARKIRKYYPDHQEFLDNLKRTLYQGFMDDGGNYFHHIYRDQLLDANPTLKAVQQLCLAGGNEQGVRSVITYNYDNLLEIVLPDLPHQPIYRATDRHQNGLPIFHVHGYVPMGDDASGSPGEDIVFTEDQYHQSAQDPYSWRNLVQVQALSRSVGLMVGLSLADRNMRRFLDAVKCSPLPAKNFALLRKTRFEEPSDEDIDRIHHNAMKYMDRFERSGVKSDRAHSDQALFQRAGIKSSRPAFAPRSGRKGEPQYRAEIRGILSVVEGFDQTEQEFVLNDLGITPIWYESYSEIPEILGSIGLN